MRIRNKTVASVAVVVAATLALAGCSSTGGAKATETTAAASTSGAAAGAGGTLPSTPRYKIWFITHGAPGDTFWDIVRKGAEAAAAKDNIELNYVANPDPAGQAQA